VALTNVATPVLSCSPSPMSGSGHDVDAFDVPTFVTHLGEVLIRYWSRSHPGPDEIGAVDGDDGKIRKVLVPLRPCDSRIVHLVIAPSKIAAIVGPSRCRPFGAPGTL